MPVNPDLLIYACIIMYTPIELITLHYSYKHAILK